MTIEQTLIATIEKNWNYTGVAYEGTDGGHGANSDAQAYYFTTDTHSLMAVLDDGYLTIGARAHEMDSFRLLDGMYYDELDV